jgi:hypothetical protein
MINLVMTVLFVGVMAISSWILIKGMKRIGSLKQKEEIQMLIAFIFFCMGVFYLMLLAMSIVVPYAVFYSSPYHFSNVLLEIFIFLSLPVVIVIVIPMGILLGMLFFLPDRWREKILLGFGLLYGIPFGVMAVTGLVSLLRFGFQSPMA